MALNILTHSNAQILGPPSLLKSGNSENPRIHSWFETTKSGSFIYFRRKGHSSISNDFWVRKNMKVCSFHTPEFDGCPSSNFWSHFYHSKSISLKTRLKSRNPSSSTFSCVLTRSRFNCWLPILIMYLKFIFLESQISM